MKTNDMKTDEINAVDMVRQIRDQQYEQTKNMDTAEKRTYYQQKSQSLMTQLQSLIQKWRNKTVAA